MRISTIIFCLLLASASMSRAQSDEPSTGGGPSQRDIAGRALAAEVVQAVGGMKAWKDPAWDLSFDFVIRANGAEVARFSHIWYRALDRYIVSGTSHDGKVWRVRFTSLSKHKGFATLDNVDVPDTALPPLLNMAYGRFINDSYWLLMPFKLLDSGVYPRREADTTIDGKPFEVLSLSFGHVGLTPGDHYRLYIDPKTKLVRRWHFSLQNGRDGDFLWDDYTQFGPMKLALLRRSVDGSTEIRFENVSVDRTDQ